MEKPQSIVIVTEDQLKQMSEELLQKLADISGHNVFLTEPEADSPLRQQRPHVRLVLGMQQAIPCADCGKFHTDEDTLVALHEADNWLEMYFMLKGFVAGIKLYKYRFGINEDNVVELNGFFQGLDQNYLQLSAATTAETEIVQYCKEINRQ